MFSLSKEIIPPLMILFVLEIPPPSKEAYEEVEGRPIVPIKDLE